MRSTAVTTKTKEWKYVYLIILLLLLIGCKEDVDSKKSDKNMLTKKQIIEITNEEATSRGIKINILTKVLYDVDNKEWKERYAYIKQEEPNEAEPYVILEKADYQAVCYYSRMSQLGGGLWVFVDRKTGKIIAVHQEE